MNDCACGNCVHFGDPRNGWENRQLLRSCKAPVAKSIRGPMKDLVHADDDRPCDAFSPKQPFTQQEPSP